MSFLHSAFSKMAVGISALLISIAGFISPSPNAAVTPAAAVAPAESSTTTVSVAPETQAVASTSETEIPSVTETTKKPAAKITTTSAPQTKPLPNRVVEIPQAPAPAAPAVAAANPAAACLPTKKDWDAFILARSSYETKYNALVSSYKSYSNGTNNSPSDPIPYFQYLYSRLTAGKTSFAAQADNVRKAIDSIPKPMTATDDDFQLMKDAYNNAILDIQNAFDLSYQSATLVGGPDASVGTNALNSAISLNHDAQDAYKKAGAEIVNVSNVVAKLEKGLNTVQSNGCQYYFLSPTGGKVWTTTPDERAFSQSQPSVTNPPNDYTQASVTLTTNLPIEINDNGTAKTVMRLNCFYNYYPVIQRTSSNTVSALVEKSLMTGNKCVFIYSGNGDDFSTGTVTMPW